MCSILSFTLVSSLALQTSSQEHRDTVHRAASCMEAAGDCMTEDLTCWNMLNGSFAQSFFLCYIKIYLCLLSSWTSAIELEQLCTLATALLCPHCTLCVKLWFHPLLWIMLLSHQNNMLPTPIEFIPVVTSGLPSCHPWSGTILTDTFDQTSI